MLEIILAGGWLMAPILLCSTLAVAIIIERFWSLRRRSVVPEGLGDTVRTWAAHNELDLDRINQIRSESALGRVLAAAIINRHRSREIIKEAVEDTGRHVVHELERFLNTLGTIAGIAPLLGLLGTVIGMIRVFTEITVQGTGNANALAGGISEALITTAAGLAVAIPSLVMHRYFTGKIDAIVVGLEQESIKLVDALHAGNKKTEYDL